MRKKSSWRKQARTPNPSLFQPTEDDTEIHLSDEDMQFLDEYAQYTHFLTSINPEELTKNKVLVGPNAIMRAKGGLRVADTDDEEEENADSGAEMSYEQKPRAVKAEWKREERMRLPVKDEAGRLKMQEVVVVDRAGKESEDDQEEEEERVSQKVSKTDKQLQSKPTSTQKVDAQAQPSKPKSNSARLVEAQEQLAETASSIISDPEKNIANLKTLRQITTSSKSPQIKKLALLTQLAVYKDIIPGYRFRPLTEAEQAVKVSKEVKRLRTYEETLLSNYQAYLQLLENTVQQTAKSTSTDEDKSLLVIAIQCMADLLTSVTHFNFRLNLMTAVVSRMTLKHPPQVSTICCTALSKLFDEDESGEASLEAVRLISQTIKAKNFNVKEDVLKTFLRLRLNQDLASGTEDRRFTDDKTNTKKRKKDEPHQSRKARKINKHAKEVEKEMKEAEATYDREEVNKRHTETLKFVFLTYFRILKNAPSSPLLGAVLEGLAKFAHLINVEFFGDLLNVLKKISFEQYQQYLNGDGDGEGGINKGTARSAFHCVIAAFQLLSGQGEALNLDLKDFYTAMYAQMMRLAGSPDVATSSGGGWGKVKGKKGELPLDRRSASEIELALQGFELLFYKKRQVPTARVAAFLKRLTTLSLNLPPNAILACLSIIRSLLIRFPRLEPLLDPTDRLGTGIYHPYLDDPELSNPFATSLWELSLLQQHYHPTVKEFAKCVAGTFSGNKGGGVSNGNVQKPLPAGLNMGWEAFLNGYDNIHNNDWKLVPGVEIPGGLKTVLKRKKEKGIKVADGPCVVSLSGFLEGLEGKVEEGTERGVFVRVWEEREVEGWREEVERLRALVEVGREGIEGKGKGERRKGESDGWVVREVREVRGR